MLINWNNVIDQFSRNYGINDALISFLNEAEIAEKLSREKINTQQPHIDLDTTESFMHHLVCENRLTNKNFKMLTQSVPYDYGLTEISGINREKMEILVTQTQIAPKPENFNDLKINFPELHQTFLDVFVNDVMEDLESYKFDGGDITHILKSEKFDLPNKLAVIETVEESIIIRNTGAVGELRRLMFNHHPLPISKTLMIAVLNQYAPLNQRIQLFNMYYKAFDGNDAQAIFGNFPAPYNKIGIRHTSFVIDSAAELQYLANNLQETEMIVNHKPDKKGIKIINFKWN